MGRLTLNILLSFAQFEREVTGERIRDKISASKAKGMWMGGTPPLGYDVRDRKLVVNEQEAALVRDIFARYAETGSAAQLVRELQIEGHTTKVWVAQNGRRHEGKIIDQQCIFTMLRNRLTLGRSRTRANPSLASTSPSFPRNYGRLCTHCDGRKQGPRTRYGTAADRPPVRAGWPADAADVHPEEKRKALSLLRALLGKAAFSRRDLRSHTANIGPCQPWKSKQPYWRRCTRHCRSPR